MRGTIYIEKINYEWVDITFKNDRIEKKTSIPMSLFSNRGVAPGQVYTDCDHSDKYTALGDLQNSSFFEVEIDGVQQIKYKTVQVANSQEEAEELVRQQVAKRAPSQTHIEVIKTEF